MVKNIHLFMLLCGALITLHGCKAPQNAEEPEPEKGQFKVVLTSDLGQTKAFWEADPDKRKLGELCEQELHSVTLFIYDLDDARTPIHFFSFSAAELARKSSVFSLPVDITSVMQRLSFRAIANIEFVDADKFNETVLLQKPPGDIFEYLNPTGKVTSEVDFSSIYPNGPTAPAVALRDVASGKGFVMSSESDTLHVILDASKVVPRTVNLKLARVVSRIEIQAHTTPEFAARYPGSTLVVKRVSMSNMPRTSVLCTFPEGITPTTIDNFVTLTQSPKDTELDGLTHHNFIFYCYENTQRKTTPPWQGQGPQLTMTASFDFDGDPLTITDIVEVTYNQKLKMSNEDGSIFRNRRYQIEVKLNGLTEREVVSSIEILPWETVTEEVNFGS